MSIIERVEAASGPDRELDAEIWTALGRLVKREPGGRTWRIATPGGSRGPGQINMPALTASLDAVSALIAEKLPDGWGFLLKTSGSQGPRAIVFDENETAYTSLSYAANPATILALLAALETAEAFSDKCLAKVAETSAALGEVERHLDAAQADLQHAEARGREEERPSIAWDGVICPPHELPRGTDPNIVGLMHLANEHDETAELAGWALAQISTAIRSAR